MEQVYLDCLLRAEVGKNKVGALRSQDFIPAVVYGRQEKALAIKCDRSKLIKFLHLHHGGENIVITLRISDGKSKKDILEKPVLIKEIQYEPVKDDILHIDFHQISLTEKIKTKVPITANGEAIGVKKDAGVLTQILWELEIECLPSAIPEKIEVDISNLAVGQSLHVKDFQLPVDIKVLSGIEAIVFTVEHPKKAEEAAGEEGAVAASQEPEVIKEKKEKEEEKAGEKEQEAAPEKKAE